MFVLGVFDSPESEAFKFYSDAALVDNCALLYTSTFSKSIKSKLKVESSGELVIILKTFDEGRNELSASVFLKDPPALSNFVRDFSVPLIQTFSSETSQQIFGSSIKVHSLFFTDTNAHYHDELMETFTELSIKHKGKMLFVNVPSTEQSILDYIGVKNDNLPAYSIINMTDSSDIKKFLLVGKLNSESIATHINNFFNRKLKPTLKSEEPEIDDTSSPVVVRGKSFDEIFLNNDKDVFV